VPRVVDGTSSPRTSQIALPLLGCSGHREQDITRDEPRVSSLNVGASHIQVLYETARRTRPCAHAGFVILSPAGSILMSAEGVRPFARASRLYDLIADRVTDESCRRRQIELSHDRRAMRLHCFETYSEKIGNLFVCIAFSNKLHHAPLAVRKS
jgi:hypothetical protein